ncbi:hypothetical protein ACWDA3_57090 [Nonomuraea rubra]
MSDSDASSTDPDDQSEIITALAADLEQLSGMVTSLTTTTSTARSATPQLEPPPKPWCWPKLPHARKADRLGELGDWLTQVLFGWPSRPARHSTLLAPPLGRHRRDLHAVLRLEDRLPLGGRNRQ